MICPDPILRCIQSCLGRAYKRKRFAGYYIVLQFFMTLLLHLQSEGVSLVISCMTFCKICLKKYYLRDMKRIKKDNATIQLFYNGHQQLTLRTQVFSLETLCCIYFASFEIGYRTFCGLFILQYIKSLKSSFC